MSSFYLDRIDELIPEKKSVAEKLFKNKENTLNPSFQPIIATPMKSKNQSREPKFRMKPSTFNLKGRGMSDFQRKKEKLKYKLMFKSEEEYRKDKERKNAAKGLKFLRKLGRKLRNL